MVPLGAIVCGPVAGWLVNRIGRKSTMMLLTLPLLAGLLLICGSLPLDNIYVLYVGRFLAGEADISSVLTIVTKFHVTSQKTRIFQLCFCLDCSNLCK